MKIKLDESPPSSLQFPLSQLGHDVSTAADENLLASCDDVILAAATEEGRALFSFDLDFADIRVYPPGSHGGHRCVPGAHGYAREYRACCS